MSINQGVWEEGIGDGGVAKGVSQYRLPVTGRLTDAECGALFREMQAAGTRERDRLRDVLVMRHLPVVYHLAAKFANRGEPVEDLVQVGNMALIGAVDRFDPDRGVKFTTFAVPAIVGEIKRYFRDRSWAMKVPRRLKDLNGMLDRAAWDLERQLGRPPSLQEVASAVRVTEEEALEAIELNSLHTLLSLDAPVDHTSAYFHGDLVGGADPRLERVIETFEVRQALDVLLAKEREVIELRFFQDLSQSETAHRLGISQMHVSRLQRRALLKLRDNLQADAYL